MNQEQAEKTAPKPKAPNNELHQAPSMLWFMIPLGLLMLYVVLSR